MPEADSEPARTDAACSEAAVDFLSRPAAYPDRPARVEARETHMAWVFLTEHHAYKLKKPVRFSYLDYSTVAARQRICQAEVHLNRRLAPWVYLGVVPLQRTETGTLSLVGPGEPVDWLVKMRRLPAAGLLDQAIAAGGPPPERIDGVARLLAEFFRDRPALDWNGEDYAATLRRDARDNRDALLAADDIVSPARVEAIYAAFEAFVNREPALVAARAARLVEGHGDLKPEHVYLGPPPAVIDCIEFSRAFRINDPLDELSFLAMECRRLDNDWIGEQMIRIYCEVCGDTAPSRLTAAYTLHRALLRAKLSYWHLQDTVEALEKWRGRTRHYVQIAEACVDALI